MRYESFYPFAHQQPAPRPMGQSGFGLPPYSGQQQNPYQPSGPIMNNPYSGPMSGSPNQAVPNPMAASQAQGGSKVEAYMQTANRFLNTAQQFAPVVQQIAPMVQNLPAMWRLYKGFQGLPPAGGAAGGAASAVAQSAAQNFGPSIPRIFQPPGR